MGLVKFIRKLFEPSAERLQREEEKRQRLILLVMSARRKEDEYDCPHFWTIYDEMRKRGWYMPASTLVSTMRTLVQAGFVQRIDGGDKHEKDEAVEYCLSERGVNHITYLVRSAVAG